MIFLLNFYTTVLHLAVEKENIDIIKLLLSNNDNKIYVMNNQGKLPVDITTDREIIQLFDE